MIKRRVKAMKKLQMKAKLVEGNFFEDLNNIENKYRVNRLNPLYDSRKRIVQGDLEESQGAPEEFGVPMFWLHAMLNCDTLKPIIQEQDKPILTYLTDIRVVNSAKPTKPNSSHNFHLEFHFVQNDYFKDLILVKEYEVSCCPEPEDLIAFGGPEIVNCKGCRIQWNKGKNATLRPVKKLQKSTGLVVQKWAKRNSFFNFFNPPRLTGKEALTDIKKTMLLEAHFEIGLHFKESFIPKAIIYFLSEEPLNLARRGSIVGGATTSQEGAKKGLSSAGGPTGPGGKKLLKQLDKKKGVGVLKLDDSSSGSVFSASGLSMVRLGACVQLTTNMY